MSKKLVSILIIFMSICFLYPVIATVVGSFLPADDLAKYNEQSGIIFIPSLVTINQYYIVLIENALYIKSFWVSVMLSTSITILHILIAIPTAYVFAKVPFKGREPLFFVYLVIMLMPYQITLLPNFIIAKATNLYDTYWAIILPGIFAPFGIFFLRQFMKSIPQGLLDAVELESKSPFAKLKHVVVPISKPGIVALAVLIFAENWNMVEQPLVMLEDNLKYPLSVLLNSMKDYSGGVEFAGAVIYMIPIVILFLFFENEIVRGIEKIKF